MKLFARIQGIRTDGLHNLFNTKGGFDTKDYKIISFSNPVGLA
jgi:hypothetical protein